jgi:polar amino acid transport system substrate-binding protein
MLEFLKKMAVTAGIVAISLNVLPSMAKAQDQLTLEDIQASGVLRVGSLVDFPPFGFMDESNQPAGLDIDVAQALADRMGVDLEIVPVTGPNRIPFLQTGRIDLVAGALSITPERAEQVLFSDPYSALQTVLYARRDLDISSYDDLDGLRIGVARASPQDGVVTENAPESTEIRRFDEISAVYQSVLAEQVDGAAIGTLIVLELNQHTDAFETKFSMYQSIQGAAMRIGSEALAEVINGYIAEMIENGELNEISQRWLDTDLPDLTNDL